MNDGPLRPSIAARCDFLLCVLLASFAFGGPPGIIINMIVGFLTSTVSLTSGTGAGITGCGTSTKLLGRTISEIEEVMISSPRQRHRYHVHVYAPPYSDRRQRVLFALSGLDRVHFPFRDSNAKQQCHSVSGGSSTRQLPPCCRSHEVSSDLKQKMIRTWNMFFSIPEKVICIANLFLAES